MVIGNEAEFVMENTHISREHKRYVAELSKNFKKGSIGILQLLNGAYQQWCEQVGLKPQPLQMVECFSNEENKEVESGAVRSKGPKSTSNKLAKSGKTTNPGKISHRLADLSLYWDSKMVDCSVKYWRAKYGRKDITVRLEERYAMLEMKAKIDEVWASALGYNITHWTNIWSQILPDRALSDVGENNVKSMEQAIADSKATGDHSYIDDPYLIGGALENMCPWTGKYQVGWDIEGSNGMEQVTVIPAGRLLLRLAPTGRA
ncbi:uncharacterized protein MELLADRAFT_112495 [Melampsora larici-populina 98AG31]|uniref:Uncharacterized protein n=1 Tax=Melampsora larici-populina (strain 98AG31 / pathotype 3-4-7) TaxID=747676 RepID=F4S6N4_MELLP|nr:uncharacterized protein MELLADRAFT_112495 [Melampsora larici-populina 98AG31]EGF99719.1 hypothetical protein MELLADRAFT_112495 [Melampsora larici-populina 98AG31]